MSFNIPSPSRPLDWTFSGRESPILTEETENLNLKTLRNAIEENLNSNSAYSSKEIYVISKTKNPFNPDYFIRQKMLFDRANSYFNDKKQSYELVFIPSKTSPVYYFHGSTEIEVYYFDENTSAPLLLKKLYFFYSPSIQPFLQSGIQRILSLDLGWEGRLGFLEESEKLSPTSLATGSINANHKIPSFPSVLSRIGKLTSCTLSIRKSE